MATYKVVVSDQVFPTVDLERGLLQSIDAELSVADGTREGVLSAAADADAILNTYLPWDAEALNALQNCKIIARYGIGTDNVDLDAARAAGITVTNVPDYCVEEVAAHGAALMLAALRRVVEGDRAAREGLWKAADLGTIRRLSELTVGLVGYGRIGSQLGKVLDALGMDQIIYDPYLTPRDDLPELVDLDDLFARADVISLHAPLTPQTRHTIDAAALGKMKSDAILINTSRGGLVNTEDLMNALRNGDIGGAAIDVAEVEPIDPAVIEGVPNLTVTPHMAYLSDAALKESQTKATTQIIKVLTGETPDYAVT